MARRGSTTVGIGGGEGGSSSGGGKRGNGGAGVGGVMPQSRMTRSVTHSSTEAAASLTALPTPWTPWWEKQKQLAAQEAEEEKKAQEQQKNAAESNPKARFSLRSKSKEAEAAAVHDRTWSPQWKAARSRSRAASESESESESDSEPAKPKATAKKVPVRAQRGRGKPAAESSDSEPSTPVAAKKGRNAADRSAVKGATKRKDAPSDAASSSDMADESDVEFSPRSPGRGAQLAQRRKRARLEAQPQWLGSVLRRDGPDSYYTQFKKNGVTYGIGDVVKMQASGHIGAKFGFHVGRVQCLWEDMYKVKWAEVRWLYRPEETHCGRLDTHGEKYGVPSFVARSSLNTCHRELFESNHVDENSLETVDGKIQVVSKDKYDQMAARSRPADMEDVWYRTLFYDASTKLFRTFLASDSASETSLALITRRSSAAAAALAATAELRRQDGAGAGQVTDTPRKRGAGASRTVSVQAFDEACAQLQLSAVPAELPCRVAEREQIMRFLETAVRSGGLGCALYVSGMPGTGKTATVNEVLRELHLMRDRGDLPAFNTVEINAMKLSSPYQAYSTIWHALTGRHVAPTRAAQHLESRFSTVSSTRQCTVVVLDELDYMVTKKQTVLYNLFEWPTRRHSRLVVVGIANTMDLPERLLPKVHSRLGLGRLVFAPYTRQQIQEIVTSRLQGLDAFDAAAIEMAARKVASISGDVRRALQICRRAAEVSLRSAGPGGALRKVSIDDVNTAASELCASQHLQAIAAASAWERVFLIAVTLHLRSTGTDELSFMAAYRRFKVICQTQLSDDVSVREASEVCSRLGLIRLLHVVPPTEDRYPLIRLQVPLDDVVFALRNDKIATRLF